MKNEQREQKGSAKERRGKRRGEKSVKRRGERTQNKKIKEEERRRRSADDDDGSGQGAVERGKEGKEEDSVVRVWERDKGWKGGERRGYLTVPPREAVEVLIRNAGDHLHGTRCSTPSPPSPPPPSFRVSTPSRPLHWFTSFSSCLAPPLFCFPFSCFRLSSRLFCSLYAFLNSTFFSLLRFIIFRFYIY